jgi:pyruvate-ferredoxin/flavodoxin oxidoreductase
MYTISGELLPAVFHVSARALAAHALSIFGDHSDVMACRQTGFAMLASNSVQEAMDMALVAHIATLKSSVPFLHFFDGFRTSHEVSKIDGIEYSEIAPLIDADDIKRFKARAINPEHPSQRGTAQNPDIYFQGREAANKYYDAVPAIVKKVMTDVAAVTGRKYKLYDYVGAPDAARVIVMMGSGAEAAHEAIDYLTARGEKIGLLKVRLFRPFAIDDFVDALPKSVKKLAVLDRTKEPGSIGEPLYQDVLTALAERKLKNIAVVGGRYGLGSKEFNPTNVLQIFNNLKKPVPLNHFTVGINDDVTNLSLPEGKFLNASPEGNIRCKFYGLGSDGTVGANKNSIKIIGDHTDLYAQAYFMYDSKKSGGITVSHLRFGKKPIKSTYLIDQADFIACHNPSYVTRYDMAGDLKPGGIFLLNSTWSPKDMEQALPAYLKNQLAAKKAKFYTIDAAKIAGRCGLGNRINVIMQAAFFKLANVIPYGEAEQYMKDYAKKSYGKKGDKVVQANWDGIEGAVREIVEVRIPKNWLTTTEGALVASAQTDKYFQHFINVILEQKGDSLPVSALSADGSVPTATSQFEKRGIAATVPEWIPENCIQCNQCSLVCPHAVIRPKLAESAALAAKPASFVTKPATGAAGYEYRMQISPLDCTGCSSCSNVCPAKNKALVMKPLDEIVATESENFKYALTLPYVKPDTLKALGGAYKPDSVKGSQFLQPLFEYSGACAGCGETPYIKLITQLFGDRMIVANATGCTSIYGGSAPTCPYCVNSEGEGPAWANSLFEDNAEFGYGMNLAYGHRRAEVKANVQKALAGDLGADIKEAFTAWLDTYADGAKSKAASARVKKLLPAAVKKADGAQKELLTAIFTQSDCLVKKSVWIFGGDGWAYDIGYGGLDHVLACGEDVNVLVVDTEVYSNTGGQASKSTPTGSVAKFAAAGKRTKKKDLGMMAMSYGYVYVAQVAMGANMNQLLKAVTEAEAYSGPSLIIAYATCINHGIDMSRGQAETKKAVDSGYWQLYRYNPTLADGGANPFSLDSKEPTADYQEFLSKEIRYTSLLRTNPDIASVLFKQTEADSKTRLDSYKKLAEQNK